MDITCILAAACFFTGNLLLLIFYAKESLRDHYNYDLWTNLEPSYIESEWDWRIDHRGIQMASGIINAIAWFFFAFPMLQLVWILSKRGSRMLWLHVSVGILILSGSFTEWISRFLMLGANRATELLVKEFNLSSWVSSNDDVGWRTLEVVHIVVQGLILFVDAFEWLILFISLFLIYISVRGYRPSDPDNNFGLCWNSMGLFISLLSLLDFVAEILRLDGFKTFGQIAFWYASVNRLILIPTWLLILGRVLPRIGNMNKSTAPEQMQANNNGSSFPQPSPSGAATLTMTGTNPTPSFTIDD